MSSPPLPPSDLPSSDSSPSDLPPSNGLARPWLPPILPIAADHPLRWLVLGFRDLTHNPLLSLAHGVLLAAVGGLITWLAFDQFWLLMGLISVFMVTAPVLATSLYAMSRAIERGEPVNMALLVSTWTNWNVHLRAQPDSYWTLIRFGLLLGLASLGWVLTSSALIWTLSPVPIHTPMDFLRHIVLGKDKPIFEIWLLLGGLMAAPVFASSVVSMPMLLDRRVSVLQAVLTSWKAVLHHPIKLALWAFVLMVLTLLGVFSLYLGLVLIVPLLGHASWHAYRELVDVRQLSPRWGHEGAA